MSTHGFAGWAAGGLTLIAFVPYILSILRGQTTPNRASWFIWAIVCALTALTYEASGARATLFVAYAFAVSTATVAVLSLKYGEPGISKLDRVCLIGATCSLIPWLVFHNAPAALYLNIAIDLFAVVPTLRKAWVHPESEDRLGWSISATAMVVNLFAVEKWTPELAIYPIYCVLAVGGVAATLHVRRGLYAAHLS